MRAADGMRKSASGPDRKTMTLHISKGSSDVTVTGGEFTVNKLLCNEWFGFVLFFLNRVL